MIGVKKLQKTQKLKKLIESQSYILPSCKERNINTTALPYTSPLRILMNQGYWSSLLNMYFQRIHTMYPIVSIKHFNPKTASQLLIAAMYYAGYKLQPEHSKEVTSYMDSYAWNNLKYLFRSCSLTTIQALYIYYAIYRYEGKTVLYKTCYSHATRIAYALGLQLDSNIFSELDKYSRRLVFCRVHSMNFRGASPFNFVTELGVLNTRQFKSEWQDLSGNTVINYDSDTENLLFSKCCTYFYKFLHEFKYNIYNSSINSVKDSRFKSEWNRTIKILTSIYQKHIRIFASLYLKYPQFFQKIAKFEIQAKVFYHEFMIDMYRILKSRLGELNPKDINDSIYHCDCMLKLTISSKKLRSSRLYFIYIIGYQYLRLYQFCSASNMQMIRSRLKYIIEVISSDFCYSSSLSFIILKNGYDLIVNSAKNSK